MGLRSSFDLLLGQERPLDGLANLVWQNLAAGASSPKHPWNLGGLITLTGDNGAPSARTVVIRAVDQDRRTIDCHTDRRSEKAHDLMRRDAVSWLLYESSSKIQLRITGTARVITQGEEVDAAWQATSLRSRSAYVTLKPPGMAIVGDAIPDVSDRDVDQQASERGREQFAIVRTLVTSMDWLYLRRDGHVRASITMQEDGSAESVWLNP